MYQYALGKRPDPRSSTRAALQPSSAGFDSPTPVSRPVLSTHPREFTSSLAASLDPPPYTPSPTYAESSESMSVAIPPITGAPVQSESFAQMCCMVLHNDDKITFTGLTADMIKKIHTTIDGHWPNNQKKERLGSDMIRFKLAGAPWSTEGPAAVKVRAMILAILRVMAQHGWNLLQAPDLSTFSTLRQNYYFKFQGIENPGVTMFAMSYCWQNMIRIIDGPDVLTLVREAISTHWPPGIIEERVKDGWRLIRLADDPSRKSDIFYSARVQRLIAQIMAHFFANGFRQYGRIEIKAEEKIVDTWAFRDISPAWT